MVVWIAAVAVASTLDAPVWVAEAPTGTHHQLAMKLSDAAQGRADATGGLTASVDVAAVQQVAAAHGLTFRAAVPDAPWVASLRERAEARTGAPAPDLAGILWVDGPADAAALLAAGEALRDLPLVESAWVEVHGVRPPSAVDLEPPTASFDLEQRWQGAYPGLNHEAAHALGYRGAGIRLTDVEYSFGADHEDLPDVDIEPDQTALEPFGPDHGTATLGQVIAVENGYGMTGAASDASGAHYTEYSAEEGVRRPAAVTRACADSIPGDVVMLEMQAFGWVSYAPAEYDLSVWLATEVCTAAGVTVVGAAGNGTEDLDGMGYSDYRSRGDSGAIIVGAGTAGTDGLTDVEWFSTYGSRVDVQGWGSSVATLGYGDLAMPGGDTRQAYTGVFSGTSSATPTIAAAAVLIQQASLNLTGTPLEPTALRQLLRDTGTPQVPESASRAPIGPQPDVGVALDVLLVDDDGDGFGAWYGDCDDADPERSPDAVEDPTNALDDDCDGVVDEGAVDLGGPLAGTAGEPVLVVTPDGSRLELALTSARPEAGVFLVGGRRRADAPAFGGISIPSVSVRRRLGLTDGDGALTAVVELPEMLGPGATVYLQLWIEDPEAVEGMAATSGWSVVIGE
jgi:hypothetical protein